MYKEKNTRPQCIYAMCNGNVVNAVDKNAQN